MTGIGSWDGEASGLCDRGYLVCVLPAAGDPTEVSSYPGSWSSSIEDRTAILPGSYCLRSWIQRSLKERNLRPCGQPKAMGSPVRPRGPYIKQVAVQSWLGAASALAVRGRNSHLTFSWFVSWCSCLPSFLRLSLTLLKDVFHDGKNL